MADFLSSLRMANVFGPLGASGGGIQQPLGMPNMAGTKPVGTPNLGDIVNLIRQSKEDEQRRQLSMMGLIQGMQNTARIQAQAHDPALVAARSKQLQEQNLLDQVQGQTGIDSVRLHMFGGNTPEYQLMMLRGQPGSATIQPGSTPGALPPSTLPAEQNLNKLMLQKQGEDLDAYQAQRVQEGVQQRQQDLVQQEMERRTAQEKTQMGLKERETRVKESEAATKASEAAVKAKDAETRSARTKDIVGTPYNVADPTDPTKQITVAMHRDGTAHRVTIDNNGVSADLGTLTKPGTQTGANPAVLDIQDKAKEALGVLNQMVDANGKLRPEMTMAVGKSRIIPMAHVPGTNAYAANTKIDRFKALLTQEMIDKMRAQTKTGTLGWGRMTNKDLDLFSRSATNLDAGLPEEDFEAELRRLRGHLTSITGDGSTKPTAADLINKH